MSGIIETVLVFVGTWILKGFADWWVKKSKSTENRIDDFLAKGLRELINIFKLKK